MKDFFSRRADIITKLLQINSNDYYLKLIPYNFHSESVDSIKSIDDVENGIGGKTSLNFTGVF